MNIEKFHQYCIAKKGVEETFPFGPETLVFKVMGKMFALAGLDEPDYYVNLKCDPERAIDLREEYPEDIKPGWHMSKTHWNSVFFEHGLPPKLLTELIDHSYDLVVKSLKKADREALEKL